MPKHLLRTDSVQSQHGLHTGSVRLSISLAQVWHQFSTGSAQAQYGLSQPSKAQRIREGLANAQNELSTTVTKYVSALSQHKLSKLIIGSARGQRGLSPDSAKSQQIFSTAAQQSRSQI